MKVIEERRTLETLETLETLVRVVDSINTHVNQQLPTQTRYRITRGC